MQENPMQPVMQPFIKLAQSNLELLTKFSASPELMSQSMANVQNLFQQGQGSALNLMQSNAFAQLSQGLMKNYTEFMTELAQSSMAALQQGQAAMIRQAHDMTDNVVDASEVRGRRARAA